MSQVYITNASTKLILRSLKNSITIDKRHIEQELNNDFAGEAVLPPNAFNYFFTPKEQKELYVTKMLFKDMNELLNSIRDNHMIVAKYIEIENKKYAKPVSAPAYHSSNGCEWLNKDFSNITLPRSIDDESLREKYKVWIQVNGNKKFIEVNESFKREFGISEDLEQISLKNSGNTNVDNFDTGSIVEMIIKLKFENMNEMLFNTNEEKSLVVKRLKYTNLKSFYSAFKGKEESEEFIIGEKFHIEKDELKKIIYEFYRKKYNQNLAFEGSILDSIGFRACKSCS